MLSMVSSTPFELKPCRFTETVTALKPWLLVKGLKANEASRFYKAVFGAIEVGRSSTFQRMGHLVSVELKIGALTFMVTDNVTSTADSSTTPPNLSLHLETENLGAAVAKAVSAGAVQEGEVVESGGNSFGKLKDPYGFVWIMTSPSNVAVSYPKAVSFTKAELWLWVEGSKLNNASKFYEAAFGAVNVSHSSTLVDPIFPFLSLVKLKLGGQTFMLTNMMNVPGTAADVPIIPANNIALSLETKDVRVPIINSVIAGGKQLSPVLTSGGNSFGRVKDPFNFIWAITPPSKKWFGVWA